MRRLIAIIMSAIILIMANGVTVNASERACNTSYTPSLSFSGTTATCKLKVIASNMSYPIEASVTLKHGNTVVKQWTNLTANGIMNFSDTAEVISGNTYTMQVTLKINGVSHNVTDIVKTCP
ncbi:MAG: hypothetical protein K6F31_07775 [Acetatifactor sp.]|nr:hypothetical protein [Acetatifactor sp.]